MGLFSFFFGGGDSSSNERRAKDGTRFRPSKDGGHVVIERPRGGTPSVGHNKGTGGGKGGRGRR
jgi:hypothetical protein